jgi:putative photosynthetic complex assembly protein 2
MTLYLYPALFALFVWWFSTGVIIYLDGLPRETFKFSMVGASVVFFIALWELGVTSHQTDVHGAYMAFFWGVFAWGWQEISFYMGYVTGTRKDPCPEGCSGWKHFLHAIQTSLWHELAIIASATIVVAATWHAPNRIGMWTFMVLWWMHQSAKLNVFLGVRNLNEEFLPEHLTFLKSFLTKKPMNLLFPVSITVSTAICAVMVQNAAAATTPFARSGATFIATMMALAIIEHWFLVVPLPAQKLWSWGLASRTTKKAFQVEIVAGFLGAGKTTFMRRRLAELSGNGRTIVLVNDFASVGVDGSLLAGQGADVVELPNGCICCSLKTDLGRQLSDMVARFAPDRVLIEPSGVADLASLVQVLNGPTLVAAISGLAITTILDAAAFLPDFARMQGHITAQVRVANAVIVNKADLVTAAGLRTVYDTVHAMNPGAIIKAARFGLVDALPIAPAPAARPRMEIVHTEPAVHDHHGHDDHHHAHAHEDALGMTSWTADFERECDADQLQDVLDAITQGRFGQVERVKGIARAGNGWIHFDVAGGRSTMAAFAPGADEAPRVVAIGRSVDKARLSAAFAACEAA